jgi:5'-phosphate synthase pdxT subunit
VSRTRPRIGVLAVQGEVREHVAMMAMGGADAVAVRRPRELAEVDGLVLPGGESTTMVKLATIFDLLDPLRERAREGLPMFGTCAGMILLADRIEGGIEGQETIGGLDVVVRRNAFGRQVDSFEADLDLHAEVEEAGAEAEASLDGPFHAVFIRAPWVEQVGEGVEVLGTVASGPAAGRVVAVRQGHLMATSFHPEITGDGRVHAFFARIVRSAS